VLTPIAILTTVFAGLVAVCAILAWELRRGRVWRAAARFGASWVLGIVPAVYLARLFSFHDHGVGLYYAFVLGLGLVLAVLYDLAGRRSFVDPTMLALGVIIALLLLDVLTGARLQLSTAYGYTATIGVRFAGLGNVAYAFLGASTVFFAGLLAYRIGGRRGAWIAVAVMAVAFLIDATPFLGGDVGGVLSLTPAYLVTALLLLDARVRRRTVVLLVAAAVAALALAAAVDLARPAKDRTHLGRLITNARERGWHEITDVIGRKLSRNLDTWTSSIWRSMLAIGILFAIYLLWRGRHRLLAFLAAVPPFRASLIGFAVLIVLGYAVNDSGVAIPGVMLVVFVATMAGLLTRAPADEPAPDGEPDEGSDGDGAVEGTHDGSVEGTDDGDQSEASTAAVLAATPSH
jgi:hypothetical protein